jgi:ferredoxin
MKVNPAGYRITDECTACGVCKGACPVGVISEGEVFQIDRAHCLECGSCLEVCPVKAIEPARGL